MTSRLNAFKFFGIALVSIAVIFCAWQIWSNKTINSSDKKTIGAWLQNDYARSDAPAVLILGDSQLGGLRSADAKVAGRKLDFALDHRSYAVESELRKINFTTGPSRLDISNALSKLGFANSLNHPASSSRFATGGVTSASPKVFIASQPGSIASDYYVMTKGLISEKKKPEIAVITINPRTFLDNGLACPGDSSYFRFFAKHASLNGPSYNKAYPEFRDKSTAFWKNIVRSPIDQVAVGQFVFLPDDAQSFNDKTLIYPPNFSFEPQSCRHQIWFLNETLTYLKTANIKSIVVSMPMLQEKQIAAFKKLHDSIKGEIAESCQKNEAVYVDLTDDNRFVSSDFLDPVHLSQNGGAKVAKLIAQYATETGCHDDTIQ
ncbi:MAG: hypothetical protein SGJ27_25195 [Candidatus Melainabacteria bacterium]|nr:hypothetical protein [Candidatus Melainabacteria bacterium]